MTLRKIAQRQHDFHRLVLVILIALAASSCASLSPAYPDNITPPKACDQQSGETCPPASASLVAKPASASVGTLGEELERAENLQKIYVGKINGLSDVGPGVGNSLITLSALALYKGVTHPNTSDMAGAGALGSALYAYGSQTNAPQRQYIYQAGINALSCATMAARPYDVAGGKAPLSAKISAVQKALASLEKTRAHWAYLNLSSTKIIVKGNTPDSPCSASVKQAPDCGSKPLTTDRYDQDVYARACQNVKQLVAAVCAAKSVKEKTETTEPSVAFKTTYDAVDRQMTLAYKKVKAMDLFVSDIDKAAITLRHNVMTIATEVDRLRVNAEPDLSTLPAKLEGMRGTAQSIVGQDFFPAKQTPKSQAGGSGKSAAPTSARPEELAAIDALQNKAAELTTKTMELDSDLVRADNRVKLAKQALANCLPKVAVVQRDPAPAADAEPAATPAPTSTQPPAESTGENANAAIWEGLGLKKGSNSGEEFASQLKLCKKQALGITTDGGLDSTIAALIINGKCSSLKPE